jgi:hypothetical protein
MQFINLSGTRYAHKTGVPQEGPRVRIRLPPVGSLRFEPSVPRQKDLCMVRPRLLRVEL